jgi:predicted RNA-binding protein
MFFAHMVSLKSRRRWQRRRGKGEKNGAIEMAYYLDLFSPETYEGFSRSDRSVSGFRKRHEKAAGRIGPGDRLICYMTKLSRWVGILEVSSTYFIDDTPRFYGNEKDPFVVRFRVKPIVWLPKEHTVPIHEDHVWNHLSFTRNCEKNSPQWTGKIRGSLVHFEEEDGRFLEDLLQKQAHTPDIYELDEDQFRRYATQRVRRENGVVPVTVPVPDIAEEEPVGESTLRESHQVQALLAKIGEAMAYTIWLPRSDRGSVEQLWTPKKGVLLSALPLNYDDITLRTIEQIDVLWLKRRSIVRAFEVEHTTSVYSGILRMADLLALQPNMDIKLHIVAPMSRREKVFAEIQRPVFSLLERAPLAECCTFLSYDSVEELARAKHLGYLSDAVLDEYAEEAE